VSRIGLFGGTFDPIHLGHLRLAEAALREANLDRVMFLPAGLPPHKQAGAKATGQDRFDMVRAAIEDRDEFMLSDYDLKREGRAYTVDTMRHFREVYPDDRWYFIIGGDSLSNLLKWNRAEELVRENAFIAMVRPGFEEETALRAAEELRSRYGTEIILLKNTAIEVSSTLIRDRQKAGQSCRDLMPGGAEQIMRSRRLYR